MKILVADDDATSRAVLAAFLRKNSHEVLETVNGADAWTALQQPDAPRLAILDWVMPEMDGVEVIRRVRAQQSERSPYLVMLTTRGENTDIAAGLDAGADDYVAKPFDQGELRARIDVGRRMTEMQDALIESRKALEHQATHDSLTGMLNRFAILDRLERELDRAARHGDKLAVGICDIDHFKQINDTQGHQTGDDVLREVARTLSTGLRSYDAVGRIGGEEFLLIAPLMTAADPDAVFDRLCERVARNKVMARDIGIGVTVSIGVACASAESTVDTLVEMADAALYQAKADGRNRAVYANRPVEIR